MTRAIEDIQRLGLAILEQHGGASDKAAQNAKDWGLEKRQGDEYEALLSMRVAVGAVAERLDPVLQQKSPVHLEAAAVAIEHNLPIIEESFLTVRHAALDLLRWSRRSGYLEGSPLPDAYRASYARLVAYTPEIKPRLDALRKELLGRSTAPDADPTVTRLLSAITRYNGVMDAARGFVQAIVDPPLELVFQETQGFLDDYARFPVDVRAALATGVNDCCQFLLYDEQAFFQGVENVRSAIAEGIDSSLYSILIRGAYIIFSVDEDPLFNQLTVTLYRAVGNDAYEDACATVAASLYQDLR